MSGALAPGGKARRTAVDVPWSERLPGTKRRHLEGDLQRAVHQYLTVALPPDAVHFAIPNGLMRSKTAAARARGEAVRAGIPDLCVIFRGRAAFIELKTPRGVQSQAQRDMANKLIYAGAAVCLCKSVQEVERSLLEACIPLRGQVAA